MSKNMKFQLLIMLLACLPSASSAANLYFKDGGIVECIFAKQQGDTVYVLVNKYTEVELDRREIAIQKSFKKNQTIGSLRRYKKARTSVKIREKQASAP